MLGWHVVKNFVKILKKIENNSLKEIKFGKNSEMLYLNS